MTRGTAPPACRAATLALCLLLAPTLADAQAFVPSQGEGSVSFIFQSMHVEDHYLTSTPLDVGAIDSQVLTFDLSYGLTDRVTVDFALPFVLAKYTGAFPHPLPLGPVTIDDGRYHGTFQDVRLAVRYNLLRGRTAVTPFVGSFVPSNGYEYFAHSAAGRRLNELAVGASVAVVDAVVPGAFLQGRYSYGFVERVLHIAHNRSNLDLEVGYFVTPGLRLFLLGAGQITHGGIDLPVVTRETFWDVVNEIAATPEGRTLMRHHDQIDRSHYLNVGGGASVSLTESVDLFASFMRTVAARNGHALDRSITLGLSWGFSRQRTPVATTTAQRKGSLVRCICQKAGS